MVIGFILHLGAAVYVKAHHVPSTPLLDSQSRLTQRAEFSRAPSVQVLVVHEVHRADSVREEIQDTDGDEAAVEAVALVVGA